MVGAVDILSINEAFSRIFMILQELTALLARTVNTPIYEDVVDPDCLAIPSVAERASKLLGFNSSGCVQMYTISGSGGIEIDLDDLGIPEAKNIYIQDDRPVTNDVALWIDTTSMAIYYLNYNDGNSTQDVEVGPGPGAGASGAGGSYTVYTIKEVTTTTYTFILEDGLGVWIDGNNASPQTFTVPPSSSVDFPIGSHIEVNNKGAGAITFAPGSGVTINSKDSNLTINGQHVVVSLIKRAADTWSLVGDLA